MSQYLIDRIVAAPTISVRYETEVAAARGDGHLESLTLADRTDGGREEVAGHLAVRLHRRLAAHRLARRGGRPRRPGFVVTGPEIAWHDGCGTGRCERPPYALETSVPGVFAAGDVRLDSMKRVASAVGEGAMAVHLVHRYLATI